MSFSRHSEQHLSHRNNWLRAGVLGANDGLISVASLLMGLAAAQTSAQTLLLMGCAAVVAGAVSMAAGEYVSVSSQSDTEKADLTREANELEHYPEGELAELAFIYQQRGVAPELAKAVAKQMMEHDALAAHARDEIGISEVIETNALQAAGASAIAFCVGAILPLLVLLIAPQTVLVYVLAIATLLGLASLGSLSAKLGGAPLLPAILRTVIWGVIALVSTALIGWYFGVG
ncbi:VIT1/CCC1 transporter family protein [Suttonella ornithocola]|uniref:VIT family n=1 Tax=Suttonella ornithocola TaxID=279832 RepID=A0A380MWJ5_9GAMM|nr:VIT family protein [Suttonella ornithocola]SUO95777.1 VIT family [Suttonella ornithocola]